ncbi:hypothetical protein F5888DRAFT_1120129 [Russula emetica]|nr:hypothetical protein F5888DRAFT_1120129 [Russula emetica]
MARTHLASLTFIFSLQSPAQAIAKDRCIIIEHFCLTEFAHCGKIDDCLSPEPQRYCTTGEFNPAESPVLRHRFVSTTRARQGANKSPVFPLLHRIL